MLSTHKTLCLFTGMEDFLLFAHNGHKISHDVRHIDERLKNFYFLVKPLGRVLT